ncbi:carboxypeptidase regulatory-like domain-containing protein [Granulicella sp. dw_53]|uniref:TonB-dependent receptor n=1 Tax=Granulicella sp. dw_53 TaxID=2719792 RepID=UPI001BD397B4
MGRHLKTIFIHLAVLLGLAAAPFASAQIDQGGITGTITDSAGNAVQGASVTLLNQDNGLSFSRSTGSNGSYTFSPIKIGTYTLTISAPSFQTLKQQNINVSVSQTVGLNLKLKPGEVSDTVTVTTTPELQTEDASTGQVFSAATVADTPLDGRNYVFIAQLTTGVAAPNQGFGQVAKSGDFSSNGSRVSQNNFVLDGVDNNSNLQDFLNGATYAVRPPPDALAEFKVQSSEYSAELGHSTGAAINASIKSGTNQFHGSLWEYFESDRLAASDYFNRTGKTAFHQNQFGATFGGPIWHDKLFFFADAQGDRISSFVPSQPNQSVPTAQMRNGDFTELLNPANTNGAGAIALYLPGGNNTTSVGGTETPGTPQRFLTCNGVRNVICPNQISPVAQRILNLFPAPNQGAAHQVFQNYTIPATSFTINTTQYDARLDFNPSEHDQIFGRYSYSNNPTTYTPPLGILDGGSFGATGQSSNYAKSGVFGETHFFSPTLSNEFRVGYNFLHASYLQVNSGTDIAAQFGLGGIPAGPTLGGFPLISFGTTGIGGSSTLHTIGVPGFLPSDEKQDVLQIIDNVSKVWGRHSVKVGINFQHIRFFGLQPPNGIGTQSFSGVYTSDPGQPSVVTGSGVADFLLDDMNNSALNSVTPLTDLRWYEAAYAQDDWKVTPRLTLNLGLRWEYTQPVRELNNHQANFVGNYAPNNQGTGTYIIPQSQQNFPIAPVLLQTFARDHIGIQYSNNDYLVNPRKVNFAPRIGLAFAADPKTVIRAGGGLFYGGLENIGLGLNLANNAPFFANANFIPTPDVCQNVNNVVTCPTNGQTLETGFGAAANDPAALANAASIGTIYANDQNAKSAVTTSYNLNLQHALSDTLSFTIGYQGNESKHLRMSYNPNVFNGAVPKGANGQSLQPFFDFNIVNVANQGIGRYDSLQTKIEKKYSNGLYFLAGYTWAHCLDDAFGPIGQSQQGGYRNPTALGFRYDYGACTQDVRNRFTFSPQYELPFGKGRKFLNKGGIVDALAGGWKTSFIFQVQSGNPIFLTSTNQGSSYPFRIGDPFASGGTANPATQPQFNCATKTRTLQQWFNPCAFANPPQASTVSDASQNLIASNIAGLTPFGPRGRQSIVGPGFNKLDMSLFKSFKIPFHESALQVRGDAFNLLNHPSFSNPGSALQGSSGQAITQTRFSGILPNARVIQLAMRLSF